MSGCASSRPARWQRGGQRYQRRKHATIKSSFRATTPPRAQPGQSPDVSNWKVARFTEAKSCGEPAARRSRRTVLGRFLQCVKKHAFQLVGNVKANDAQIAYPNDCFVLGFQYHHGSLPPAAVMALWPSFSRFGSSQLLRNHPHVAVLILHLWVTHICPIRIAGKEKEGSCPIACATSPMHVSRDHNLRQESIHQDRSPRWIGPRRPKLVSVGQQALAFTEVWKSRRDYLESRLLLPQQICAGQQPALWDSAAYQVPNTSDYRFSVLCKESRYDVGDTTLSFARSETKRKHSRHVPRYF